MLIFSYYLTESPFGRVIYMRSRMSRMEMWLVFQTARLSLTLTTTDSVADRKSHQKCLPSTDGNTVEKTVDSPLVEYTSVSEYHEYASVSFQNTTTGFLPCVPSLTALSMRSISLLHDRLPNTSTMLCFSDMILIPSANEASKGLDSYLLSNMVRQCDYVSRLGPHPRCC